jgi:hypothetical protein
VSSRGRRLRGSLRSIPKYPSARRRPRRHGRGHSRHRPRLSTRPAFPRPPHRRNRSELPISRAAPVDSALRSARSIRRRGLAPPYRRRSPESSLFMPVTARHSSRLPPSPQQASCSSSSPCRRPRRRQHRRETTSSVGTMLRPSLARLRNRSDRAGCTRSVSAFCRSVGTNNGYVGRSISQTSPSLRQSKWACPLN